LIYLAYDYRKKSPPRGHYSYAQININYFEARANGEKSDFDTAEQAINWILTKYDEAE